MLKRKDLIIMIIIIIIIISSFIFKYFFFYQNGTYVQIKVNGQEYQTVPLNIDRSINIAHKNTIVIKNNNVFINNSTCPDKLCQKQGKISKNGQQIICLPNQVIIEIVSNQKSDVDISTH